MQIFVSAGGGGDDAGFGCGGLDSSRGSIVQAFLPVLRRHGTATLAGTATEGIAAARRTGGVHFCLALPHELPDGAGPETIPVFGLSVADCPPHAFRGDLRGGWAPRLMRAGRAVCFSAHAARAVRELMGQDYPVIQAPPPVLGGVRPRRETTVLATGSVLDTARWQDTGPPDVPEVLPESHDPADPVPADPYGALPPPAEGAQPWRKTARYRLGTVRLHLTAAYREAVADLVPSGARPLVSRIGRLSSRGGLRLLAWRQRQEEQPLLAEAMSGWTAGPTGVSLGGGLVFAAVHGAWDRSWGDLLSAFVTTFSRNEAATLVVKTTALDAQTCAGFEGYLRRLGPFACRVVILNGEIDGGLDRLIDVTTFYVCASHSEAAPVPMARFLAAGRPAVAPAHSALADFIEPSASFVVASGPEYEAYPGDYEERLSATGWRLEWESLCAGLQAASTLARTPDAYQARAAAIAGRMAAYCDPDVVADALAPLFTRWATAPAALVDPLIPARAVASSEAA